MSRLHNNLWQRETATKLTIFGYVGGIVRYVERHLDARWLTERVRSRVKKASLYVCARLSTPSLHREFTDSDSRVK